MSKHEWLLHLHVFVLIEDQLNHVRVPRDDREDRFVGFLMHRIHLD